mgnify:CR=1 FL=1
MTAQKKMRAKLGIPAGRLEFELKYGYDDDVIAVMFGDKVDNLIMTLAQCDEMIAALKGVRGAYLKHKGRKRG